MRPAVAGAGLGIGMGVFSIAGTYLAVTFLRGPLEALVPVTILAVPLAVLWPRWFDRGPADSWGARVGRRLLAITVAAPIAAVVSYLLVAAAPGYITWADDVHRASLERAGKPADEIEEIVAAHHQQPRDFLTEGAILTAVPGLIAALVTTGASAIVLRRRPLRP